MNPKNFDRLIELFINMMFGASMVVFAFGLISYNLAELQTAALLSLPYLALRYLHVRMGR